MPCSNLKICNWVPMPRGKRKIIASEANNVEEGMEVHAQFGDAYYNGTVTSVEGEYFFCSLA